MNKSSHTEKKLDKLAIVILEEMQYQKDLEEFDKKFPNFVAPSFEEVLEKQRLKSTVSKVDTVEMGSFNLLKDRIIRGVESLFGFEPQFAKGSGEKQVETVICYDENGAEYRGKMMTVLSELDVIYTDISILIGKILHFQLKGVILAKCEFRANKSRGDEGMIARGFIVFNDNLDKDSLTNLRQEFNEFKLNNLEIKIVDRIMD